MMKVWIANSEDFTGETRYSIIAGGLPIVVPLIAVTRAQEPDAPGEFTSAGAVVLEHQLNKLVTSLH